LPGGRSVVIGPRLENFPGADVVHDVQRFNALLEAQILKVPEQYLWVHRRFKGLSADYPESDPLAGPLGLWGSVALAARSLRRGSARWLVRRRFKTVRKVLLRRPDLPARMPAPFRNASEACISDLPYLSLEVRDSLRRVRGEKTVGDDSSIRGNRPTIHALGITALDHNGARNSSRCIVFKTTP
jgi:hypothetical protein